MGIDLWEGTLLGVSGWDIALWVCGAAIAGLLVALLISAIGGESE